jgi:carboxymethylenebutenolidase
MSFKTQWLRYGPDSRHSGFLAFPERAAAPLPAVIVIQEAWGVDPHIEDVALRVAKAGYAALAPDLFADHGERPPHLSRERMETVKDFVNSLPPGVWANPAARDEAMGRLPEPRRSQVGESFGALFGGALTRLDAFVPKLMDAARFLRSEHPLTRGAKVACVGFCMGGGLSALLACNDPELSGAAIFYGSSPPADLVPKIACPVTGFYGSLDQRINGGVPAFVDAMKAAGKSLEHQMYEGAQHGFFNDTRATYHAGAVRDSFARFLAFLQRTIAT